MGRGSRATAVATGFVILASIVSGSSVGERTAGDVRFVPSPKSPLELGAEPSAFFDGEYVAGDGFDDLVVVERSPARVRVLANRRAAFRQVASAGAPDDPVALARRGSDSTLEQVAVAGEGGDVWLYRFIESPDAKLRRTQSISIGGRPSAVVYSEFFSFNGYSILVADRAGDSVVLLKPHDGAYRVEDTIPVGDAPSAIATGRVTDRPVVVANSGSDTVSVLPHYANGDVRGHRTVAVGDEPVAVALEDFVRGDSGDDEIAVANRQAGTITLLDRPADTDDFVTVATYPVGGKPTALAATNLDAKKGVDLAVVSAGTNEVTVLRNQGGEFSRLGSFQAGRRPIGVVALAINRHFVPDLAVLNAGSRDVTLLLRREPGRCKGRPARVYRGTAGDDFINGSPSPDVVAALEGDDFVSVKASADCVSAGAGDDEIDTSGGPDRVNGGAGRDRVVSGGDSDVINAGTGNDRIYSDRHRLLGATLLEGGGRDVIDGGKGNDTIETGGLRDRISGGAGRDRILVRGGDSDVVDCGGGRDTVRADSSDQLRDCEVIRR